MTGEPPKQFLDGRVESEEIRHLADELNSLLDGSLRNIGLASRLLHTTDAPDRSGAACARLAAAQEAMWQMSELLERAIAGRRGAGGMLHTPRALWDEIARAIRLLRPLAEGHGVELHTEIDPEAGALPAGPLATIVLNGLRNAVQACGRQKGAAHRVELRASLRDDELTVAISDTGPGLGADAPHGYGLGIKLCRKLIDELGGTMTLGTAAWGWGTLVEVVVPRERLHPDG